MAAGIITGIGLTLAVIGFNAYARDKGWALAWWQWLVLGIGAAILLLGFGALGVSLAEGTNRAGWILFGLAALISLVLGFAALRRIRVT